MTKDFWERIDRLEALADYANNKHTQQMWLGTPFCSISIEEFKGDQCIAFTPLSQAKKDNFIAAANPALIMEMIAELRSLEKEADYLAKTFAGNMKIQGIKDGLRDPTGGHKEFWRETARKAVAND